MTKSALILYFFVMVRTNVSSKGQTTIPRAILKAWNTRQVLWDLNPDGSARVAPAPNIMSLMGSAAGDLPRDLQEKQKSREAIGRHAEVGGRHQK